MANNILLSPEEWLKQDNDGETVLSPAEWLQREKTQKQQPSYIVPTPKSQEKIFGVSLANFPTQLVTPNTYQQALKEEEKGKTYLTAPEPPTTYETIKEKITNIVKQTPEFVANLTFIPQITERILGWANNPTEEVQRLLSAGKTKEERDYVSSLSPEEQIEYNRREIFNRLPEMVIFSTMGGTKPPKLPKGVKRIKPTIEGMPIPKVPSTEAVAKEPWQMTKGEYRNYRKERIKESRTPPAKGIRDIQGISDYSDYLRGKNAFYNWKQVHKESVYQAISEGKPIPLEVLADYPNLVKQVAKGIPKELEALVNKPIQIKRVDLIPEKKLGQYSGNIIIEKNIAKIPKERPELYNFAPKTEKGTILHELGHKIENELSDNIIAKFNTIKSREFHPKKYNVAGDYEPLPWPEDFAESFSKWSEHSDIFRKEFPQRAKFFDELGLRANIGKDTAKLDFYAQATGKVAKEVPAVVKLPVKPSAMPLTAPPPLAEAPKGAGIPPTGIPPSMIVTPEGITVKQIIKEAVSPQSQQISRTESQLLTKRIRDEARGAKWGYGAGEKTTRDILVKKFKEGQATLQAVKKDLVDIIKAEIPPAEQGKFLTDISRNLNPRQAWDELDRIIRIEEKATAKELISEIKKAGSEATNLEKVAVDYRKMVGDILAPYQKNQPSEKRLQKIMGLYDYVKTNPQLLVEHPELEKRLALLTKKPLTALTNPEKQVLLRQVEDAIKLGRLKLETRIQQQKRASDSIRADLLTTTRNRDISRKSFGYRTRRSMQIISDNNTTTPMVAYKMDGYKWDANTKRIQWLGNSKDTASVMARNKKEAFMDELGKIYPELPKSEEAAIGLHLYIEQEGFLTDEVFRSIMVENGWQSIPQKTERMQKAMDLMRKYAGENFDELQKVYINSQNEMMDKVTNYFPAFREGEMRAQTEIIPYRTKRTESGFTISREPGAEGLPRLDVVNVLGEHLDDVHNYIIMQPKLDSISRAINNSEYIEKAGVTNFNYWRDVIDITARQGGYSTAWKSFPLLGPLTRNVTTASIALKASSVFVQPFAIFPAMASAVERWGPRAAFDVLSGVAESFLIPGVTRKTISGSKALQLRYLGEPILSDVGGLGGIRKLALKPLQWADIKTTSGVQRGIERTLLRYKIPNAKEESEFFMHIVSGSNNYVYQPMVLAKGGQWGKTTFALQNFMMSQWSVITHQLAAGVITQSSFIKKIQALTGLGLVGAGLIAEELARNKVNDLITGRDKEERPLAQEIISSMIQAVPVFGYPMSAAMMDYDPDLEVPVSGAFEDVLKGGKDIWHRKTPMARWRGVSRVAGGVSALLGVPGTKQAEQLLRERVLAPAKNTFHIDLSQRDTPILSPEEWLKQDNETKTLSPEEWLRKEKSK